MNYTPLNIKTDNSILSSLIKVNDLINYAKENNLKSLAIADTNLFGAMDFYMQSIKNNIKPIIGLELNLENNIIYVYCKSFEGYKNLIKLNKIKSEREINFNDLLIYKDELICLIPFESKGLFHKLREIYSDIYLTYKNEYEKGNIIEKSLYANEVLCLKKEDTFYLKYLYEINASDRKEFDNYLVLESNLFNENNYEFEKLCNLEIPLKQNLLPVYKNDLNLSSYDYLKKLCIEGMKAKFGNTVSKEYQLRLKHELDVINKMNFSDYFLVVYDYVKYAKDNNILVGPGRGSAVSSLVAYLLDITKVDPVKNNLLFERFLNVDRISMPDIDIDFEHIKREEVINYCIKKYGEESVMPIVTFGTLKARQLVRELANVLNINEYVVNDLSKMLDSDISIKDNLKNKELNQFVLNNHLEKFINIASKLEGLKHHVSIHAAGVVMSNNSLEENIPVIKYNDKYITGIDMTYLEEIGILKMDFLAIKFLTIIHNIIDEVNKKYQNNLTFDNIPLNDPKTFEIFQNGYTMGIFQFESEGMANFLKKLKPKSFEDLTSAMALYRPGPMQHIDEFIENRNNPDKIKYIEPRLKEILSDTYGIFIYQEQIMQTAIHLASFTNSEADTLRKAMSKKKKDVLANLQDKFVSGCIKNNIDKNDAQKIFDLMLKFAEYGFNKSHSYGYSLVSYKMAYLKAHFKEIFASIMMSEDLNDKNKQKKYIFEFKKLGLKILKPSINKSGIDYTFQDDSLLYPLNGIKGINLGIAKEIIEERKNGDYKDIFDFIKRCFNKNINQTVLKTLILSSCFDEFKVNKRTLVENLDSIVNYGELLNDIEDNALLRPVLKEYHEYYLKESLKNEKELFGVYLSNHPTLQYKGSYPNITNLDLIEDCFDKVINVIVNVDEKREIMTKKNEKMCFLKASDEEASADITIFPKTYMQYSDIEENDVILVKGRVEKRFDQYQIIVEKIKKLSE